MTKWLSFSAVIGIAEDINPCVDLPKEISGVFGLRGFIPVELDLLGSKHLANLVPLGQGNYRLYLNAPMLKATGWKVGDMASIRLRYDPKPRVIPVPLALEEAFKTHPKAKTAFDSLTPSRRKQICMYLNNLKTQVAIDRNIPKAIAALEGTGIHLAVNDYSADQTQLKDKSFRKSFTAKLTAPEMRGGWTYVKTPFNSSKFFGRRGNIKFSGSIDGHPVTGNLMPLGDGTHMFPVKADIRKIIGKQPPDNVTIVIETV